MILGVMVGEIWVFLLRPEYKWGEFVMFVQSLKAKSRVSNLRV